MHDLFLAQLLKNIVVYYEGHGDLYAHVEFVKY